jgi:hypothetical protein
MGWRAADAVFNPDRFPTPLRTNFYLKAERVH